MKKLLTSVDADAVVDWGLFEGVREIIQNGLDAGDRGFRFDIVYLRNKEELLIYNDGASLTRSELLVGRTSKRGDKTQRGRHGDGLKMASVALIRCGKTIEISNGLYDEVLTTSIEKHPDYGNAPVLCFNISKPEILPINKNKLIVKISGITPEEVSEIKYKFLQWEGLELGDYYKTVNGKVLLPEKYKGKIFDRGIYVCDIKNLQYGYDFEDLELGRDRNLASDFDVHWKTSKIWASLAGTHSKEEIVIKMLKSDLPDVKDLHYLIKDKNQKSVFSDFSLEHGEKSYPCSSEYQRKEIQSLGYKPVFVGESYRRILEPSLPSIDDLKKEQALKTHDDIDMTQIFSDLISKGWKIKYFDCVCGGKYAWLKPDDDLSYSIHGCICHDTPIKEN